MALYIYPECGKFNIIELMYQMRKKLFLFCSLFFGLSKLLVFQNNFCFPKKSTPRFSYSSFLSSYRKTKMNALCCSEQFVVLNNLTVDLRGYSSCSSKSIWLKNIRNDVKVDGERARSFNLFNFKGCRRNMPCNSSSMNRKT